MVAKLRAKPVQTLVTSTKGPKRGLVSVTQDDAFGDVGELLSGSCLSTVPRGCGVVLPAAVAS
ncbi:hypothetical protein [Spirillospora sp. CA-294931]|uniref:hypothetical protein n=1 Tax=Spirillospora sp. CA-294931 TaxID=3240042 RepID=UPI003D8C191C